MEKKRRTIALIIWWCEGTKVRKDKRWKNSYSSAIEVTNTNPDLIKIFVDFLLKDLKIPIEKLHGQVQIHEEDDKKKLELYWSKITGIPLFQFNKTIVRKIGKKAGKTKGTFKVRMYDKAVCKKIQDLLSYELIQFNGV